MINITLPDGSQRQFENPVTVGDVAASIGAGPLSSRARKVSGGSVVGGMVTA